MVCRMGVDTVTSPKLLWEIRVERYIRMFEKGIHNKEEFKENMKSAGFDDEDIQRALESEGI